ncbi:MAG: hypothetical protein A3B25_01330 [Candidatus Ryanbacteria bacterium RIFCSPLOWO2_01_FULL_48_26]|uniref:Vitamin K epoxide reductase domain-containing protein n=1 Tax=Candidatus Ryanbacteria bacterium RIFCSPLOWO2_01_FULL_48_26 TaxID=1802126 RepID=A0A1G2GU70_9BACT|nr:MAG: hypothetical protein A3B25_01330 [Candidatus Ryanbacteria bacterium RIFCSPLOWO2_01_FULL_48_26]
MTNSKTQSLPHWGINHKRIALALVFLALLGFIDATYLTIAHYRGGIVPCANISNCEKVLTSQYSTIAGVPVALIGSLYYFSVFLFTFLSITRKNERFLIAASAIITCGFLASLFLIYLQLFVIHAICLYCMLSATITTVLFACATSLMLVKAKNKKLQMV